MHPPPSSMGPSRRTAGFSLIELMVVVTIISILVLSIRSSFRKALANKHTSAAAADVVRLARRARTDALGLGRAHLVYFQPGAGARRPFGQVTLLRGNAMHCDHENWATLAADCTNELVQVRMTGQRPTSCVERIDLSSTQWFQSPFAIVLREPGADGSVSFTGPSANATRSLCYDAFGKVQWSAADLSSTMQFSQNSAAANFKGAFMFGVTLYDADSSGAPLLPTMLLSFPLGGNPRRLR